MQQSTRRRGPATGRGRALALTLAVLVTGGPSSVLAPRTVEGQTVRVVGGNEAARPGTVVGTAWKADNSPLPNARVRLRDVATGRGVAVTKTDARGEFRFDGVEPGTYIVELLSDRDHVLAVGELFGLRADDTIATAVRLGARTTWFDGFFGNAAAAALAAASTLGITAVGSTGLPASAQ